MSLSGPRMFLGQELKRDWPLWYLAKQGLNFISLGGADLGNFRTPPLSFMSCANSTGWLIWARFRDSPVCETEDPPHSTWLGLMSGSVASNPDDVLGDVTTRL